MKNIQVKLTFQADTNAAKQQMAGLQQQLSNLAATPIASAGTQKMRNELQQAANKAVELKVALHNATNIDTGKLNLNKFSQQLKQNKMTLTQYAQELAKLGPQGTQAFLQLTNSIRQAETPMIALTGKMKALTNTLMNTLRWQISSSMITGVISTFTSIIDYSKELNESLNNIRIVTGKNIDQMSKFADEAQRSAKALSATTTEYTNAALIYYQQGLSDKEVKERTNTTIKLANAVGEEAQTVSEWMTAIWNNFDDGSKSMEYYADVLAKLGAATASSADEIAGGLEKFAAVAETTGLSYEYAAAALATITSETRQSEDVVGTALKTIFARIENLKLGETLEDGLNLGQYSAALEKVGVNILDANGNLKEMDTILDNIATQWNTLNNAEQVALAQSVAGIRQYNQFLALMGNWDVMEKNVELARDSTGELEKQNLIYSQGIEGSTARVQNTLDEIKNTLLDENDLIPLLEIANDFLTVVNKLLDAFGGLPTILWAITAALTKMYSASIASGLVGAGNFIKSAALSVVGKGNNLKTNMVSEAAQAGSKTAANQDGYYGLQQSENLKNSLSSQEAIEKAQNELNASTQKYLDLLFQIAEKKREIALNTATEADKAQKELVKTGMGIRPDDQDFQAGLQETSNAAIRKGLINRAEVANQNENNLLPENQRRFGQHYADTVEDLDKYGGLTGAETKSLGDLTKPKGALTKLQETEAKMDSWENDKTEYENLTKKKKLTRKETKRQSELSDRLGDNGSGKLTKYNKEMNKLVKNQSKYSNQVNSAIKPLDNYENKIKDLTKDFGLQTEQVQEVEAQVSQTSNTVIEHANANREAAQATDNQNKALQKGLMIGKGFTQNLIEGVGAMAQGAMGLSMLTSGFDSLTTAIAEGDKSWSTWISSISIILMSLPMVINSISGVGTAISRMIGLQKLKIAADELEQSGMTRTAAMRKAAVLQEEKDGKKSVATSLMKMKAKIAEWFANGPWGWAIAIAGLAAIAAIGFSIGSAQVDAKKTEKAKEQEAEAASENYDKTKEQASANKELYDSYMDLLDTYKESGKGQEDLAKAAQELTAAYSIEGAAIASLTGDYDALTESIEKARVAELETLLGAGQRKQRAKQKDLEDAMRGTSKDIAYKTDSGGYTVKFDYGDSKTDEIDFVNTVEDYFKNNSQELEGLGITYDQASGKIEAKDIDNPEVMAKMYEVMSDISSEAAKRGVTADSEGLKHLNEMLASMGDVPEEMLNLVKEMTSYVAEMRILQAENNKGQSINEVTNLADYLGLREQILKDVVVDSDQYDEIVKQLTANANTAEWEIIAQAAKEQAKQSTKFSLEDIQDLYKNVDSVGARALAMVKVNAETTIDDIKEAAKGYELEASAAELESVAGQYEISAKAAETFAKTLAMSNDALENNEKVANRVAATSIKLNKNIETLTKTWDSNVEALNNATFGSSEYAFALAGIAEDLESAFGVENKNISLVNYLNNNSKLINAFMSGDVTKLGQIQKDIAEITSDYYDNLQSDAREVDSLLNLAFSKNYQYGDMLDFEGAGLKDSLNAFVDQAGGLGALREILANAGFELITDVSGDISSIIKTTTEASWKEKFDKIAEDAKKRQLDPKQEIERYYEINNVLEDIERGLDNISKAKDRAFGKDKLAYIQQEKELLDDQISTYEKKLEEVESHIDEDKAAVLKFGFDIDDQGNIINYEETMAARIAEYNKGIKSTDKDTQEKIKENYKEMEEALKQWEETVKEHEEVRDNITEKQYEKESLMLEEISAEVERVADISERSLKQIDYQLDQIEDDAFAAAEAIALMGKKADEALRTSRSNTTGIKSVLDIIGISEQELNSAVNNNSLDQLLIGKEITADQVAALDSYVDGLYEANNAIEEQRQAVQEKVVEAYDTWNEKLGHNSEMLQRNQSMLESYRNIIDIVGKDTLGISDTILEEMSQANVKMAQQTFEMSKAKYESLKDAYEQAKNSGAVDEEKLREMEATMLDAQQEFMDSWSSALETAATEFESSVERIMEAYDKAMGDLSEKSEWFEKQETLSDFFLKNYEKTYEISKLNRQINQSIDSNDNVATQRKLRDIQSELLAYQQEGKDMSDYDLQYLQKKYDLTLAQNALEDAQNAKSQARLTRDSQGNFGYVYTANQKNIESAQQQFEDKLYAMEQFLDKSQSDLSKQWFELNQQWQEEMAALDKNAEDYSQKAADITAYYTELMENVSGEMTDMVSYGMEINQEYGTHAAETFNETILGKMYSDYSIFEELQSKCSEAMQDTLDQLNDAHDLFEENINVTFKAAGSDVEDFKDDYKTWMGETKKANDELVSNTQKMQEDMQTKFNAIVGAAQTFATNYQNNLKPIKDANEALANSINKLINAYSELTSEDIQGKVNNALNKTTGMGGIGEDGSGTITGGTSSNKKPVMTNTTYTVGSQTTTANKNNDLWANGQQYYKVTSSSGIEYYTTRENLRDTKTGNVFSDKTDFSSGKVQATISNTSKLYTIDQLQEDNMQFKEFDWQLPARENNKFLFKLKGSTEWYVGTTDFVRGNTIATKKMKKATTSDWFSMDYMNETDQKAYNKNKKQGTENIKTYKDRFKYPIGWDKQVITFVDNPFKIGTEEGPQMAWTSLDNAKKQWGTVTGFLNSAPSGGYLDKAESSGRAVSYIIPNNFTASLEAFVNRLPTYGFDTGGYTGAWGPEGRLAMLHQKEIVLNAHDTENFLTAIEIVRSIATQLENNALRTAQGLGSLVTAAAVNNNREVLEQNVTIHAEFPNATDHNEIELAFNDLINQASQYVNRR